MSFSNSFLLRRFEDLAPSDKMSPEGVPDPRGSIVVAESDPVELEHIASILRNLDFGVCLAGDGESAIRLVREKDPVLVLSSLRLPKMDGYKLCQTLRDSKETEGIPFMFIVDDGEFPDHLIGHESYAHDYIQKPISVSELKNRIQSLLNLVDTQNPASSSVAEPDVSADQSEEPARGGNRVQALKLNERIRNLLGELSSCLAELEQLLVTDTEALKTVDPLVRPHSIDSASLVEDWIPEAVAGEVDSAEGEGSELQESGFFRTGEKMSDGVEDIFSEFFAMELASRGAARKPSKVAEETGAQDGANDRSEVAVSAEETSEKVASDQESLEYQKLYENAISYVLESIRDVVSGEAPDIFRGAFFAEQIVDSLSRSSDLVRAATNREQDYAVSRHSVNVSIFATRVAQTLGQDLQSQREVCLSGLLHELGVGELPAKLIHREGSLTPDEFELIRRRSIQSGEIISELGSEYVWMAEIVSQVAERENGTGGPNGLMGEEIDERAKIIGIADVFDAYIHTRPYRDSLSGYQALFELTTDQQRSFSDQMVKALIRSFSLYPINECVLLSTGEVGKVVDINPENLSRPVVSVLFDNDGTEMIEKKTVDLGRESSLYIAEALAGRHCRSTQMNES